MRQAFRVALMRARAGGRRGAHAVEKRGAIAAAGLSREVAKPCYRWGMREHEEASAFAQQLVALLASVRQREVEFLIALAEFDRRELYRPLGFGSLWAYC